MPSRWLSRFRQLLEGAPALKGAADEPAMVAELLLLFRMLLADGEVRKEELTVFRRICREAFGIGEENFEAVMHAVGEMNGNVSEAQTLAVFRRFDRKRRVALALRMAEIAHADDELSRHEERLLARVLDMLDLDRDVFDEAS